MGLYICLIEPILGNIYRDLKSLSLSTGNTNLLGSISSNWHGHSCHTLNKSSTWVQHGTQTTSSRMRCVQQYSHYVYCLNDTPAMISLSIMIPVTSNDGIVSFKKEDILLYVQYVWQTAFAFWSRRSTVIGPVMSRLEIKIDVWKYIGPLVIGQYAVTG